MGRDLQSKDSEKCVKIEKHVQYNWRICTVYREREKIPWFHQNYDPENGKFKMGSKSY